jgi:ferritin-like protein
MAADYHEPYDLLDPRTRDEHRALISLKEEIEAVDWYHQRVELCADPSLKTVLSHNRDEEIEHACMTLEWLRRSVPQWDEQLKKYLFKDGAPIVGPHAAPTTADQTAPQKEATSLGIGSLKGEKA